MAKKYFFTKSEIMQGDTYCYIKGVKHTYVGGKYLPVNSIGKRSNNGEEFTKDEINEILDGGNLYKELIEQNKTEVVKEESKEVKETYEETKEKEDKLFNSEIATRVTRFKNLKLYLPKEDFDYLLKEINKYLAYYNMKELIAETVETKEIRRKAVMEMLEVFNVHEMRINAEQKYSYSYYENLFEKERYEIAPRYMDKADSLSKKINHLLAQDKLTKKEVDELVNYLGAYISTYNLAQSDLQLQAASTEVKELANTLSTLYISTRKKFIMQNAERKGYTTFKFNLHDDRLIEHVQGSRTYGVFSGSLYTKFITFDIDMNKESEEIAKRLIEVLTKDFNIPTESILTSFSGNKGIHVDILFDGMVENTTAKSFYNKVLAKLQLTTTQVEYRPTQGQGVKLPLGIHRVTNNRCYLLDNKTLKMVNDNHIYLVKQMDTAKFKKEHTVDDKTKTTLFTKEEVFDINTKIELTALADDLSKIRLDGGETSAMKECKEMLIRGTILRPRTRHKSTIQLLSYVINVLGHDEETAVEIVKNIIRNSVTSLDNLVDKETTMKFALKEVERLVKYATSYTVTGEYYNSEFEITKKELTALLKTRHKVQRQLAYTMLLHSKKYSNNKTGEFYMTYETMNDYGNKGNRSSLLPTIKKLEKLGLVTKLKEGKKISNMLTINQYIVNFHDREQAVQEEKITVKSVEGNSDYTELFKRLPELFTVKEVKEIVGTRYFSMHYKSYFLTA